MLSPLVAGVVFVVATAVVAITAPRMTRVTETLSDRTSLGSALFGAIFLGASTSLPGIVVTVTAALRGQAGLAAANALGGIAAQTMFLALADVAHRGPLQRAAVSRKVMAELALVVGLLALVLIGIGAPQAVLGVHVVTPLLVLAYLGGMVVVRQQPGSKEATGEEASSTDQPRAKEPGGADHGQRSSGRLWWRYAMLVALLGAAGAGLSLAIGPLASAIGLNLTAAGAILTALATSTPELLTAVAAARHGSLGLAVGDIAGGNAFDVLFLFAADIAALGALYRSLSGTHVLLTGAALLLNAVLLMGFIRRGQGILGRVASESVLVLLVYAVMAVAMLVG